MLKSDNGSPFTGGAMPDLLAARRVEHLLSPPYWPRYNGAIEAGIGALKDRTAARAGRAARPGYWTWDDTAGAVAEAAEQAHLRGPAGPTPAVVWAARAPILAAERDAFAAARPRANRLRPTGRGSMVRARDGPPGHPPALEERGYLQYRRRRILPPITGPQAARNV